MIRRFLAGCAGGLAAGAVGTSSASCSGKPPGNIEIVLLGTGSSVGVPQMRCLLAGNNCKVCVGAGEGDRNWRGNPSLVLRVPGEGGTENVLIDCGKTFRESSMRLFKQLGIQCIDAIMLTHFHADAVLGLDDLRDYQRVIRKADPVNRIPAQLACTPVYCDETTLRVLKKVFPYLVVTEDDKKAQTDADVRFVSNISWHAYESFFGRFKLKGLNVETFPVTHGNACTAVGYDFTSPTSRFVYISDVSEIPKESDTHILNGKPIDVLVIDALFLKRRHNTHFSLPEALDAVRRYKPKKTYLVGMSHEFDYYTTNDELKALKQTEGIDVEMGYDGLSFSLPLHNDRSSSL